MEKITFQGLSKKSGHPEYCITGKSMQRFLAREEMSVELALRSALLENSI